jgi:hypothetical protein
VESAFLTANQHLGAHEPLQMVAQRRRRQIDVALNLASRASTLTGSNDKPQDGETNRMTKRSQLICVVFDLRGHACASNIFEVRTQGSKCSRPAAVGLALIRKRECRNVA